MPAARPAEVRRWAIEWACRREQPVGQLAQDLGMPDRACGPGGARPTGTRAAAPTGCPAPSAASWPSCGHAGDTVETRRALDEAFDHVTNASSHDGEPDRAYWCDEAQAHGQAGYCYRRLGDHHRARSHLQEALDLHGSEFPREAALRLILLARSYAAESEPDQACAAASRATDLLTGQVDSARCVGPLRRLADQLTPFRDEPPVRDLLDKAHRLVGATAP